MQVLNRVDRFLKRSDLLMFHHNQFLMHLEALSLSLSLSLLPPPAWVKIGQDRIEEGMD